MRKFIYTFIILTNFNIGAFCQIKSFSPREKDSFTKIKDSTIKKEVAFFTIAGLKKTGKESKHLVKLNQIPVVNCTDSSTNFSKNGINIQILGEHYDSTGHHLMSFNHGGQLYYVLADKEIFWGTDGTLPTKKIKSIEIIYGKEKLLLPDLSLKGIFQPGFCAGVTDKNHINVSCKVFQSADKKRLYIYMLNGDKNATYEITWVIEENRYETKIIDAVAKK